MTEQEEKELLENAEIAFKAYAIVLRTVNPIEQEFILKNRDIFLNIFNRSVLTVQRLLKEKSM